MDEFLDIDSDKVSAFYQLSIEGSFSKASKTLGITQSGLSQKIARLEDELETTLVVRTTKELALTETGQQLIRYFRTKRELDREFLKSISGNLKGSSGEIRIGAYSSIMRSSVIPTMARLLDKYINPSFKVFTKEIYELEQSLVRGEVDFVVTTREMKRENVNNELIGEEEDVHIVPLKKAADSLPFLDHDEKDPTTYDFFKLQKSGESYRRCYFDDVYNIIEAVENGLGQGVVSKHLVKNNKKVKVVNHKKRMISKVYLCYFQKTYFSNLDKDMIEVFGKRFKEYL